MRLIDADALQTALVDEYSGISGHKTREKFYRAIEIVRRQPTIAPPPNDPLTLEELREMDGEPIYVTGMGWKICYGVDESSVQAGIITGLTTRLYLRGYGKTWFDCRRKPETEIHEVFVL